MRLGQGGLDGHQNQRQTLLNKSYFLYRQFFVDFNNETFLFKKGNLISNSD
jgi:hypothetical protein